MAKSDNDKKTEFMQLPTATIMPSGENPRIINEKDPRFVELAESVAAQGVMVPVHVRPKGKKYELLAGERRLRAAKVAKRETIPAIFHQGMTDAEAFELTYAENFCREDLTPLEESRAVATLLEKYKNDTPAVAAKMGKSERWVRLRAFLHKGLIKDWQNVLSTEDPNHCEFAHWTTAHFELVARLTNAAQAELLAELVKGWGDGIETVAQLQEQINQFLRQLSKAKK